MWIRARLAKAPRGSLDCSPGPTHPRFRWTRDGSLVFHRVVGKLSSPLRLGQVSERSEESRCWGTRPSSYAQGDSCFCQSKRSNVITLFHSALTQKKAGATSSGLQNHPLTYRKKSRSRRAWAGWRRRLSACASIWRTRSRVTPIFFPTSCSV